MDAAAGHVARRLAAEQVSVRVLAWEVGLSERQLHRRCRTALGHAPSKLAGMLRPHRFLALARASSSEVVLRSSPPQPATPTRPILAGTAAR